jgi:multidrug transporter EmrE-like cation transporter
MMAIAFLANGLCAFGARVLQDMGLAGTHSFLYLAFWYLAGLAVSMLIFHSAAASPSDVTPIGQLTRSELLIGGLMGICSSVGWIFLTRAIASGMPGYLVFPIAIGGNLSIVAVVGVLLFKERLSSYGYLGMVSGIAGIALLATV